MKKLIAKTPYYTLYVDTGRNRIYYTPIGFWRSLSVVPNYLKDMEKAFSMVEAGFSFVADVRDMKVPPREVQEMFTKAQEMGAKAGLGKTAEILPVNLVRYASNRAAQKTNINRNVFKSLEEAEAWLDE